MCQPNENEYIFHVNDPLNNIVFLETQRWMEHIIYGGETGTGHLILINEEDTVRRAVEDPDRIYRDNRFGKTFNNYILEHFNDMLKSSGQYIKVVVSRDMGGRIVTAIPTNKGYLNSELIYDKDQKNAK